MSWPPTSGPLRSPTSPARSARGRTTRSRPTTSYPPTAGWTSDGGLRKTSAPSASRIQSSGVRGLLHGLVLASQLSLSEGTEALYPDSLLREREVEEPVPV